MLKKAASSAACHFENWSKSDEFKNMSHEERIKYLCGLKLAEII
ncbi:hypothetical protein [Treponema sp. C6A8]|nr:hypothetical protein [Treponema sp. C6A8]